jgi:hypothetical protein
MFLISFKVHDRETADVTFFITDITGREVLQYRTELPVLVNAEFETKVRSTPAGLQFWRLTLVWKVCVPDGWDMYIFSNDKYDLLLRIKDASVYMMPEVAVEAAKLNWKEVDYCQREELKLTLQHINETVSYINRK